MGLARVLGFDLCPRLSHLRDRRLHVPQQHTVPAEPIAVTDRDVRMDLIASIWDEFVRVAGQCTAVQALSRFGSAARGQPVDDGGVHIGRLFRTIYLIDYFTNPAFRTELQHVLNRGEAVHTVQRAIHIGKIPLELTRHHDSLAAVCSVLALLSNAVMAWNTIRMQRAVDQIEAMSGEAVPTGRRYDLDGQCTRGYAHPVAALDFVTGNHRNILQAGELLRSIHLPATALSKRYAFRRASLVKLGRSAALLIGTRGSDGHLLITVTASTPRPVQLAFAGIPTAEELRRAIASAIPDDGYFDDVNGLPDYRRHLTYYFAEQIRVELTQSGSKA